MKPEVITELNVTDLFCLWSLFFKIIPKNIDAVLHPDTSSDILEIGLLHLKLFHFLLKVESVTSHVLLQLPKQMICHEVGSVSMTVRLHMAHVKHKTYCSHFTGTYRPFTLVLGLQHLECLWFHNTEEMEMADFECKSPIAEFLNLFQLGINASLCVCVGGGGIHLKIMLLEWNKWATFNWAVTSYLILWLRQPYVLNILNMVL
jgi:hypothetical protein